VKNPILSKNRFDAQSTADDKINCIYVNFPFMNLGVEQGHPEKIGC
jgi:hypothetical protein